MLASAVDGVPGDEACHHRGLSGAGRHPEREARKAAAPSFGHLLQPLDHPVRAIPDLGQEHDGLDRFSLRVEQAEDRPFPWFARPVLKELAGRVARPGPSFVAPSAHFGSQLVDGASVGLIGGQPQGALNGDVLPHGQRLVGGASPVDDVVARLSGDGLPVPLRLAVGPGQYGLSVDVLFGRSHGLAGSFGIVRGAESGCVPYHTAFGCCGWTAAVGRGSDSACLPGVHSSHAVSFTARIGLTPATFNPQFCGRSAGCEGAADIKGMRRLRSVAGRSRGRRSGRQTGLRKRQVASFKLFTFVVRFVVRLL